MLVKGETYKFHQNMFSSFSVKEKQINIYKHFHVYSKIKNHEVIKNRKPNRNKPCMMKYKTNCYIEL